MTSKYFFYSFLLLGGVFLAGCDNTPKPAAVAPPAPQKPAIMDPFRFHKLIEVSPGQDYDILSWGRGSKTVGAFEILHSDSAAAKYITTTGDLDGSIIDVYNSDMDLDGNPEILIQTKGKDTTNYATVYAFEFSNGKAEKLDFPKLNQSQRKGYRGNDNFYIKDGKFMREFPIYEGTGKDAKLTNQKRQLQYGLRNNSFTVTQLSKDSTAATTASASKPVATTSTSQPKSDGKEKKDKHHKTEESHKKKHKKHHHSDEG